MKTFANAGELGSAFSKVCLAIGVFDGVHLGHQQVIRQTISDALKHGAASVIVTFDCHPSSVVAPERTPLLIYPVWKKLEVIESLGVDGVLLLHFDEKFSRIPAEEFIRGLRAAFARIYSVSVGSNFSFGYKRGGNVPLLNELGNELDFAVHGLAAVGLDGAIISSTRVRGTLAQGELNAVSQMLGRDYSLCGTVVRGDQLGRKLGFPTANVEAIGQALPPRGVYAIRAKVAGRSHLGVMNIGLRPTLKSSVPEIRVEAHLFDFNREIYGEKIEILLVEKLRDERKFASVEALREQIAVDVKAARTTLAR